MKYLFVLSLLFVIISGCKKNKLQYEKDDEEIQQYISDHGLSATKTESGLYIVITDPGTGSSCNSTSNVKVKYKGYFSDGTVFDESEGTGSSFNLASVIAGWTEGIPYFREGGKGILLVPSRLGYGEAGSGTTITGSKVLIFDIDLVDVF